MSFAYQKPLRSLLPKPYSTYSLAWHLGFMASIQVFIELYYSPGTRDEEDIHDPCCHRAHSLVEKKNTKM